MFGSSILEVAIGITFIYLSLSLVCTAINEVIASLLNKRGKNLFEGVKNLLNDPEFTGLAQQLYHHGLIDGISKDAAKPDKPNRPPSYMPATNFSLAILDILGTRGVIAAVHGDLLARVERADQAYEKAKRAAAQSPASTDLLKAEAQAKEAQQQARFALETVATETKEAYEQAVQAEKENPGGAPLAQAVAEAKEKADVASAAVKMDDARRAAVACAKNNKDAALFKAAADAAEQALAVGRIIAESHPDPLGVIQEGVNRLPDGHTKESLLVLLAKTKREVKTVEDQVEKFKSNIEGWFNDAMDRVGGWYKRWTQKILLTLAFSIVFLTNIDTVMLIQQLMKDNALRASLVAAAQDAAKLPSSAGTAAGNTGPLVGTKEEDPRIKIVIEKAQSLQLPLGWSLNPGDPRSIPRDPGWLFSKIFGLLISVFAISLGAPFWFDTLSKFINIRGTGTPPGESKKSAAS
jgi:hypothetical protein